MNGPAPARFHSLDALRGVLALGVAVYHLSVWSGLTAAGALSNMALAKAGNYSVSAFFALTGFLLARTAPWASIARQGPGAWALKRLLRLAPLFWLAALVNLVFHLGMGPAPTLRMAAENLTLTFGFFHPNHALATGGWYVGIAVIAYAAWPAMAWLMDRWGAWTLFAAAAGLVAWSLPATLHGVMGVEPWSRFHAYVMPGNQLFPVALGALAGWAHGRTAIRLGHVPFLIGAGLAIGALFWPYPSFSDHLVALTGLPRYRYVACVTVLVALCAFHRNVESRWLKPLIALGGWSYGIYLAHPFLHRLVAPHLGGWTGLALALAASIALSAAAARWIERPIARWTRRKSAPGNAVQ